MATHSSWDTHSRITDLFLKLARSQHAQGVMDPEVQIGLGVLFYTNGDYDRAKDCFESALAARPKVILLQEINPTTLTYSVAGLSPMESARILPLQW